MRLLKLVVLAGLTGVVLVSCRSLPPAPPAEPAPPTEAAEPAPPVEPVPFYGWLDLFDGATFAGWRKSENPGSWQVSEGAIVAHGPRSHLFYVGDGAGEPFRDFELKAEVKTEPGSNSGIFFHTAFQQTGWPAQGIEVQVNNTFEGDPRRTGSLWGVADIHKAPARDGGWWTQHVIVKGKRVVVRIDGVTVVDYLEPDQPTGQRRLGQGTFALQAHDPDSTVRFRSVRVRRLGDSDTPEYDLVYRQLLSYEFDDDPAALRAVEDELLYATPERIAAIEGKLLDALQSLEATYPCKQFVCRILHRIGSDRCVPVVAELLGDAQLSHMARYVLERLATPAARAALRDATSGSDGDLLVGAVNSLGAAGDAASTPRLLELLRDADWAVAGAAATALGRVGSEEVVAALLPLVNEVRDPLRPAVADALLRCAERLLRGGSDGPARSVYTALFQPDLPDLVRIAALDGLVRCHGDAAVPLLIRVITEGDPTMQSVAAQYVRDLEGGRFTAEFARQLPRLAPTAQVSLLNALADRGDKAAKPAVINMLESKVGDVRSAALAALAVLGGADDVHVLLRFAASAGREERDAACAAVAQLAGEGTDEALLERMEDPVSGVRSVAVRAVAQRKPSGGAQAVLDAAGDADAGVRREAYAALPDLLTTDSLPHVIQLLVDAPGTREREAVQKALTAICAASATPSTAGIAVAAAWAGATDTDVRASLLRALGPVGGNAALWAVRRAVAAADARLVDAGVRALCDWPEGTVVDDLMSVARSAREPVHRILSLRAVLRLAAEPGARPQEATIALYREALRLASRPDEVRLALSGLADVPALEAISLAWPYVDDPPVRTEAAMALAKLARSCVGLDREKAMDAARRALAACDHQAVQKEAKSAVEMIEALEAYLIEWQVAGPYSPAEESKTSVFATTFPPQTGPEGADVEWQPMPIGTDPAQPWLLDLKEAIGGEKRAAYLKTFVFCPAERDVRLELGSDDGVVAWLNSRRIHTNDVSRGVRVNEDKLDVTLYEGWNTLMLKIVQGGGGWGASARIVDEEGKRIPGLVVRGALSDEEREGLAPHPPAVPVLEWKLDTLDEGAVADTAMNAAAEIVDEPILSEGLVGSCLLFDGVDDEVEGEASVRLPTLAYEPWSINMYVRMDTQPEELTILGGFGDVVTARPIGCQRYIVKFKGGIHFWGSNIDVNPGVPFSLGRWQMVTVTYDGSQVTIYRDGKRLITSAEKLADAVPVATLSPLDHWGKDNHFAGRIDEFTIWNGALTQAQIDELAAKLPRPEAREHTPPAE